MRRAAKRDTSEEEVVQALEAIGFAVERLSAEGMPDLLMSKAGRWYVAEVKTGKRGLTPAQVRMHQAARADIPILRNREDAILWGTMVR